MSQDNKCKVNDCTRSAWSKGYCAACGAAKKQRKKKPARKKKTREIPSRPTYANSGRSGLLIASNDHLIEQLLLDPLYDIRTDGSIWTLVTQTGKVSVKGVWREAGHTMSYLHHKGGYRRIKYQRVNLAIHRIIYAKFNGPLSPDLVVNHLDENPTNNTPSNLELITQAENSSYTVNPTTYKIS